MGFLQTNMPIAPGGFEPPFAAPKAAVLPLDERALCDSPTNLGDHLDWGYFSDCFCQNSCRGGCSNSPFGGGRVGKGAKQGGARARHTRDLGAGLLQGLAALHERGVSRENRGLEVVLCLTLNGVPGWRRGK